MGRTTAAGGALAAIALVAACSDVAEVAEVCASHTDPPVRVEERVCAAPANQAEADGHGLYEIQLPPPVYDEDGYATYPPIVVVDVGQPLPRAGQPGAGVFRGPTSGASSQRKVLRPPAKAGSPGGPAKAGSPGGSTVSRGGFGVSGSGSSSGS